MNFFSKTVRLSALVVLGAVLIFEVGCGDTFRPIASPLVSPSGNPGIFGTLTIINCNGTTSRSGPLSNCSGTLGSNSQMIDVAGDVVTAVGNIGLTPGFTGYDATRLAFFVPNAAADSVTSVSYSVDSVTALYVAQPTVLTVPAGSNPVATFIGSAEEYVLNAGSGTVCPNLSVIAIATNAVTSSYCVGTTPVFGVQTGSNVFVLDKTLNQVNVYSPQQQKFVASIAVGTTPVFAVSSYDGNFVYVVNQGSSDISIIDANALTVVGTVPTGGSGPIKAVLDRTLIRLYVVNQGDNSVTVFNALGNSTLTQLGKAIVGPAPVDLTILTGGARAFTANSGNNTLTEINTGSFTTSTVVVGTDPAALVTDVASSTDGTKLYASSVTTGNLNNGVTVFRTSDRVAVTKLLAPKQDPNCVTTASSTCALQQPQQILGGR